jgi:hypothetical protein
MKESAATKLPYQPPRILPVGKAQELVRGNGSTYTDTLGNTSTRYG